MRNGHESAQRERGERCGLSLGCRLSLVPLWPVRLWLCAVAARRRPPEELGEVHLRIMSPLIVPPRVRNMRYTPPNNAADDPMRALL